MCIIGAALNVHPGFPAILCGNRDEFEIRGNASTDAQVDGNGIICGVDKKFGGTWMGFNTKTDEFIIDSPSGIFAGLTNLRRWNAPKSRGQLVYNTLQNQTANNVKKSPVSLEYLNDYAGFNLCWSNLYDPEPSLYYISNVGRITVPTCIPKGVVGVGNDRLHDEFVKVPYLEQQMKKAIEEHTSKYGETTNSQSLTELVDTLGNLLTDQTAYKRINKNYFSKLFYFSGPRLIQPGTQTFLYASLASSFLTVFSLFMLNFSGFSPISIGFGSYAVALLLSISASFFLGLYHHHKLQNIYVTLPAPFKTSKNWKTVSQTITIATKDGAVHYYFRNTLTAWKATDAKKIAWRHFVVAPESHAVTEES